MCQNESYLFIYSFIYLFIYLFIYRIYSNKLRGAYLIFRATSAALIRERRLFKNCTRQIYFFFIFSGSLSIC